MSRGRKPVAECSTCGRRMEVGERVSVKIYWEKWTAYEHVGCSAMVCRECGEKFTHALGLDVPEQMWNLV